MALLTLRDEKGIPLTHQEMDANLRNLNAEGVTGGNAHDHTTGNGAPIPYNSLTGKPTLGTAAAQNVEAFEASGAVGTHEAAADPHPGYALESSLGTAAAQNVEAFEPSGAVGTHEAAADPHPGYALESSLGTASTANVTTSATDTTTGRLLKVGDFGVGGNLPITTLNIDQATSALFSRLYFSSEGGSLGTPPAGLTYGLVDTYGLVGDAVTQDFTELTGNPIYMRRWRRTGYNNVWTAWYQIIDQGNILTTGVPAQALTNNAIFERGSHVTNGEYTKFADGTLICVLPSRYGGTGRTGWGNLYLSESEPWTFPCAFVNTPVIAGTGADSASLSLIVASGITPTGCSLQQISPTVAPSAVNFTATAVGRWF